LKERNTLRFWHDDDNFWEAFGAMMFGDARWTAAPQEMEQAVRLMGLPEGATVLDMGCGQGRHSLALAERGFRVTGVDRTEVYLAVARQKAAEAGLSVEWVLDDMRDFHRANHFDGVISMYTSFGYFEPVGENLQVLRNLHASLKPEGVALIDVMGKEVLARIFQPRDWIERNGAFYLMERQVERDWSWMDNRWIVLRDGHRQEFHVAHWIYCAAELSGMLREAGFEQVSVFGDLQGSDYDQAAERLVVVARKAE
jgi:SAM-dependent methyltransferase